MRRDTEPGRGTLILTMGVLSIVLPAVGWVLGIIAIVMGRTDQKKIRAGLMDRSASDLTQAGWICGIIGTCLHAISCLGCGLYITMVVIVAMTFAKTNMNKGVPTAPLPQNGSRSAHGPSPAGSPAATGSARQITLGRMAFLGRPDEEAAELLREQRGAQVAFAQVR